MAKIIIDGGGSYTPTSGKILKSGVYETQDIELINELRAAAALYGWIHVDEPELESLRAQLAAAERAKAEAQQTGPVITKVAEIDSRIGPELGEVTPVPAGEPAPQAVGAPPVQNDAVVPHPDTPPVEPYPVGDTLPPGADSGPENGVTKVVDATPGLEAGPLTRADFAPSFGCDQCEATAATKAGLLAHKRAKHA